MGCANVLKEASRLAMASALEAIITVPLFAKGLVGVSHFFGTKIAPDPQGPGRNGPSLRVVTVHQVHGTASLVLDRRSPSMRSIVAGEEEASTGAHGYDAIVTNQPGVLVAVETADCVPILLLDPVRGVAAAVHAGCRDRPHDQRDRVHRHAVLTNPPPLRRIGRYGQAWATTSRAGWMTCGLASSARRGVPGATPVASPWWPCRSRSPSSACARRLRMGAGCSARTASRRRWPRWKKWAHGPPLEARLRLRRAERGVPWKTVRHGAPGVGGCKPAHRSPFRWAHGHPLR